MAFKRHFRIIPCTLFLGLNTLFGQSELGLIIGGSNYLGEIGGRDNTRRDFIFDLQIKETKENFGLLFRKMITQGLAITTSFNYARFSGSDNLSTNPGRRGRNLSFSNKIYELSERIEYYYYHVHDVGGHARYLVDFKPYLFAGIGLFYHNPTTVYKNQKYNLRDYKTEGQVTPYPYINLSVPMGLGFYMTYNNKFRTSVEIGYRKTFTDYLDDVSSTYPTLEETGSAIGFELSNRYNEVAGDQLIAEAGNYLPGNKRGDPNHKDTFIMMNLVLGVILSTPTTNPIKLRGSYMPRPKRYTHKF